MKKYLWLVLSAIFSFLSHPFAIDGYTLPHLGFFAWFSFIPFFILLNRECSLKRQFLIGWIFGFVYYAGLMFWLYTALRVYGNIHPLIALLCVGLLAVILATYLALIFPITAFLRARLNLPYFFILPWVWVSVELARTYVPLGGFPWGQLGYSQSHNIPILQLASFTGVCGVTFLILCVNLAGAEIFQILLARKDREKISSKTEKPSLHFSIIKFYRTELLFCAAVLIFYIWVHSTGVRSMEITQAKMMQAPRTRIALLQGNIPQDEKWLLEKADAIHQTYLQLTRLAFEHSVDLVIWTEASYPYELALDDPELLSEVGEFPKDVLVGAVSYESHGNILPNPYRTPLDYPVHNSMVLLGPGSQLKGVYHKQHLVPYGEYIPFRNWLPFVGKLTENMGEFQRGQSSKPLISGASRFGILICYEDIFPQIARAESLLGANLLVNISNDAWYGDSSALEQHLNFSIFRAVENGKYLLRSTNTGITAFIDPLGRIQKKLPKFSEDYLIDEVSLLEDQTFYTRHGDVFAYGCVTGMLIMLAAGFRKKLCSK